MTGYRGSGGPNGDRVWWPAGLAEMTPSERVNALAHGWWYDGLDIVTRDGRRLSPVPTGLPTDHPFKLDPTRIRVEAVAVDGPTAVKQETIA